MTGTIFERFGDLLDYLASTLLKSLGMRDTKERAILDIRLSMSKEGAERYYSALPADLKNDIEVKAAYQLKTADLKKEAAAQKSLIESIAEEALEIYKPLGQRIAATYMKIDAATPDTALERAIGIVGLDFAKDVGIGIAGLAVETGGAGQIDTMTDFFKFFKSKTSYGGIMTMLMKAPLELGVISPLSKYLHSQYRDAYLRGQAALILATKGHITEDQMRRAWQYEGYPEWQIDAVVKDRWRELRLGEIAWALNDALADEKWLDEKLKYALYSPEDRPVIIQMIHAKYLRSYRDRVATQIRNLYKEGYIDKATFDSRLTSLKIPPPVIKMLASEADYLYRLDLNADLIATWTTAYRNDIISEDVLRGNLASIIVDPARVEAQVNKAVASRKPKAVAAPKKVTQGIRIMSKPANASIFLDGADTELLTPETLETTAAPHTLTLSAEGYEDAAYEIAVEAGKFVEIYAVMVPMLPAGSAGPG